MDKRIKPWVIKKIVEYIGEEEPALTEFICQKVAARSSPQSILNDLVRVSRNMFYLPFPLVIKFISLLVKLSFKTHFLASYVMHFPTLKWNSPNFNSQWQIFLYQCSSSGHVMTASSFRFREARIR